MYHLRECIALWLYKNFNDRLFVKFLYYFKRVRVGVLQICQKGIVLLHFQINEVSPVVNIQLHFNMFTREGSLLSPAYNFRIQRRKIYSLCIYTIFGVLEKRQKQMVEVWYWQCDKYCYDGIKSGWELFQEMASNPVWEERENLPRGDILCWHLKGR